MKLKDISNQKFGRLTVLYRVFPNSKQGSARWHCVCECGNEIDVDGVKIRTGHTKSCGCLVKENMAKLGRVQAQLNAENLAGQKFGKLTAIQRIFDNDAQKYKWLCQCDCGGQTIVNADKLKSGHTKSCGCMLSYGEQVINQWLTENHIPFKTQVTFNDLYSFKNKKLRFDFGIYNNKGDLLALIEYNGKQHYDKTAQFFTEDGLQRDQMKIDYCKQHNILLYIIPYYNNPIEELKKIISNLQNEEGVLR